MVWIIFIHMVRTKATNAESPHMIVEKSYIACVCFCKPLDATVGERTVALKIIACCSMTQTPTGQSKVWWRHARKMVDVYFKRIQIHSFMARFVVYGLRSIFGKHGTSLCVKSEKRLWIPNDDVVVCLKSQKIDWIPLCLAIWNIITDRM